MAEDPRLQWASNRELESSYEATERHLSSGRPDPPFQRVRLINGPSGRLAGRQGETGKVYYYPHAAVFALESAAAEAVSDFLGGDEAAERSAVEGALPQVNAILPVESIHTAYELDRDALPEGSDSGWPWGPVWMETDQGAWLFEALRPENMVEEINRRYGDEAHRPYGVARPDRHAAAGQPA